MEDRRQETYVAGVVHAHTNPVVPPELSVEIRMSFCRHASCGGVRGVCHGCHSQPRLEPFADVGARRNQMARTGNKQFLAALLGRRSLMLNYCVPVGLFSANWSWRNAERWTVGDVRKASNAWDKAFKFDPLFEYMRAVSSP